MEYQKPTVFIGSSNENLHIAEILVMYLSEFAEVTCWTDIFQIGIPTLDSLVNVKDKFDFAIFIMTANDDLKSRNQQFIVPRDNIIFELGLFIGSIGNERVFVVCDKNISTKIFSDYSSVTYITYDLERKDQNKESALFPCCIKIKSAITNVMRKSRKLSSSNDVNIVKVNCTESEPSVTDVPIDLTKTFKNRTVSIQSLANNKYLGADKDHDNTPIFAHLDIRGNWELFEVEITKDGWAAFKACNNGKYISARDDESGTPLFACADTVQDWECFKIFLHNGNHLLKTRVNNKYIMADINCSITPGVVGLYAYVYEAQEWEQFQIKLLDKNDAI